MKTNIKHIVLGLLAATTVACSDNNSDNKASGNNLGQNLEKQNAEQVENKTTSALVKSAEGKYLVLPPSQEINTISLANEPIKNICKTVSALTHQLNQLKSQKDEAIALAKEDFSAEGSVDELALAIDVKTAEIEAITLGQTFEKTVVYSKKELLKNVETLKTANPGLVFEIKNPDAVKLNVNMENVSKAEQVTKLSGLTEGAFDETPSDVKLKLNINYQLLCTQRSLNSTLKPGAQKSTKAKLFLSFQ
ncbi:MAG: hypothetical protein ACK41T_07350 [Pseudobdellovibrio sp.]